MTARHAFPPGPERPDLDAIRAATRDHVMTPEEQRAQIISFAYGNGALSNPRITRETVEAAYDEMHGRPQVIRDPELAAISADLQRVRAIVERINNQLQELIVCNGRVHPNTGEPV